MQLKWKKHRIRKCLQSNLPSCLSEVINSALIECNFSGVWCPISSIHLLNIADHSPVPPPHFLPRYSDRLLWIKMLWTSIDLNLHLCFLPEAQTLPLFSSVQSLSRVQLFVTPWIAARQDSLSITNSQSLLKFMPIESVMPSSHLILCRPLLLLPPVPPSIRVFSNESTLRMRWPKY